MPVTREDVMSALCSIRSESGEDIVALGIIESVDVSGSDVSIKAALSTLDTEPRDNLKRAIEDAVRMHVSGIGDLRIDIGFAVPKSDKMHSHAKGPAKPSKGGPVPGVRHIVLVGSGKGGVGKSTVAVSLAVTFARRGLKTGLLDMDVYGPSIPTMFGLFETPMMDGEKIIPLEAEGLKLMSVGFLIDPGQAVIWRGPLLHKTTQQFLMNVEWGDLDALVIDLPPGTGDVTLSLSQLAAVDGAVVVSTPQEVSLVDVRKAVAMFRQLGIPVLGIVENMSHFVCDGCGKSHEIFARGGAARAAKALNIPFLGEIPLVTAVREGGDAGTPSAALAAGPVREAFDTIADKVMAAVVRQ
jgi:ATP-binding protein involved in chromosome partitioning